MKQYYLLIIVSLITAQSYCQATIGLKAGAEYSSISGPVTSHSMWGWQAGFFSKAQFNTQFAFQPEIDYSVKNTRLFYNDKSFDIGFQHVNARFLGTYNFNPHVYAGFGPYLSYLIDIKDNADNLPKNYFSKFAVGLNPSIAYEMRRLTLILRYDLGLTWVTMDNDPEIANNPIKGSRVRGAELILGMDF